MNKIICELKSAFIFNRARKAAFRERHAATLHPERRMRELLQEALSTAAIHTRSFLPYKGVNRGKDVVLVASGPSARDYRPIPGAVHVAVNTSFHMADIAFDYLFVHDVHGRPGLLAEIAGYRPGRCVKFFGLARERTYGIDSTCSESATVAAGALRYRKGEDDYNLPLDILNASLPSFGTVAIVALQFALWTCPRRIWLVGCDCSSGYFDGKKDDGRLVKNHERMLRGYQAIRRFAEKWYPDVEIISVNPVGLKGVFRDVATADLSQIMNREA